MVIKVLDPDWIRIGIQPKMLDTDLDPDEMNADPQPWSVKILHMVPTVYDLTNGIRDPCCGSVTFGYGSESALLTNGSGSCYFRH